MSAGSRPGGGPTIVVPTWFGPDDAPLHGWLHAPADGQVRGIVVLCPPVGLEMLMAYRTLRTLADRLAAEGIGVLRFAYAATGDSAGESADPASVESWLASVGDAVAYARHAGSSRVVVLGMRLGATLAAATARACSPLAGLVLWDPCASGATFLREEQALFRFGVPEQQRAARQDGAVEGPGSLYLAETSSALREVEVGALLEHDAAAGTDGTPPAVGPVLVVSRSEARPGPAVRRLIAAEGVETFEASGQPALFDSLQLAVPVAALERVVEWVARLLPGDREHLEPVTQEAAVVATMPDGRSIRERFIWIGDDRLFGIITEVEGTEGPAMILTNTSPPALHLGPSRLWVDLARRWAAHGFRVLRFDDVGIGDSPGAVETDASSVYSAAAIRDVVAAVREMRADGAQEVSLTGLCAAGWACLLAAGQVHVESVNILNPGEWDVRPPIPAAETWTDQYQSGQAQRRTTIRSRLRHRARLAARRLLPEPVWWRLARRGYIEAPAGMIMPLMRQGTRVRLLFGQREAAAFRERRGGRLVSRFGPRGLLETHEAEGVDHALLSLQARDLVASTVSEWIGATSGGQPAELVRGPGTFVP